MIELRYGEDAWLRRVEIFDWCESAFGEYARNTGEWRFFSSFDSAHRKYVSILCYDESYAALFLLRWGEYLCISED